MKINGEKWSNDKMKQTILNELKLFKVKQDAFKSLAKRYNNKTDIWRGFYTRHMIKKKTFKHKDDSSKFDKDWLKKIQDDEEGTWTKRPRKEKEPRKAKQDMEALLKKALKLYANKEDAFKVLAWKHNTKESTWIDYYNKNKKLFND